MNQQEKVKTAITNYHNAIEAMGLAHKAVADAKERIQSAEAELVRVLHVVYGDRAQKGVLYQGSLYVARPACCSGASVLEVQLAEFEVLA